MTTDSRDMGRARGAGRTRPRAWLVAAGLLAALATGCGPGYLDRDKNIPATEPNREVFQVVKAYHEAVESQDLETLKRLISAKYHENAGTTDRGEDDYGYDKLLERMKMLRDNVKKVQLRIKLVDMNVEGETAVVDYEFFGRVLLTEGGVDTYKTWNDFNRMKLVREGGSWKISAGL